MLKWMVVSILAGLVLFLQACAPQAKPEKSCNFVQNSQGERVSWKQRVPVVMYLNRDIPGYVDTTMVQESLQDAMNRWNERYGETLFEFGGWTDQPLQPRQDGWNVIYWMTDWEENRQFEQARTSIYWVGDKINEADIRINNHHFQFSVSQETEPGKVDLRSLLVHELGHVLGLGHSEIGSTVMASTLASNFNRRAVSPADVEALKCEY